MRFGLIQYLLAGALICAVSVSAFAADSTPPEQAPAAQNQISGEIGLRLQTLGGSTSSSKLYEYRDFRRGFYLGYLTLNDQSSSGMSQLTLDVRNLTLRDESASLTYEKVGVLSAEIFYDRLPHRYSGRARTIFHEGPDNVFTLPDDAQAALQTIATTDIDPGRSGTQVNTALFGSTLDSMKSRKVRLEVDRKTIGFKSRYTPSPELSFNASFSDEQRTGHKSFATTFGFTNMVELPGRVDFDTQTLTLGAEYAAARGTLQLQFNHNRFEDRADTLVWDNPIRALDQPLADPVPDPIPEEYSASSIPSRGRMPLAPSNTAQDVTLNGAYRFSDQARLTASFSQGTWRQDADFVPMTINSVLLSNFPGITALPANSLDGKVETGLQQFAFDYDPCSQLSVTARYRRYAVKDKTHELEFNGFVLWDQTIEAIPFGPEYFDFTRKNTGLDLVWRPVSRLNVRLTDEKEQWDRQHRDVDETREDIVKASIDYGITDALLFRAGTTRGQRRIRGGYDVIPEWEFDQLRRYDVANRDRNDTSFALQYTPNDRLDASLVVRGIADRYTDSPFGLQNDTSEDISVDWTYEASAKTSLYGGAGVTRYNSDFRSRYRPVPDPTTYSPELDNWFSRQRDNSRALWLGVNHTIFPEKLTADFSISYNRDYAKTRLKSVPGGNNSGNGADWPSVCYIYLAPELALNYTCSADRVLRFSYRYDRFSERDFQFDFMEPYMGIIDSGAPTSVFLGARTPSYAAHIITLEVQQRF